MKQGVAVLLLCLRKRRTVSYMIYTRCSWRRGFGTDIIGGEIAAI